MILMDQPFAGLVKELFEPQVYPALSPAALRRHRLDAALPDGRGGPRGDHAADASSAAIRCGPSRTSSGLAAPFNRGANASFRAVNQILAAKGTVSFAGDDIGASGIDKGKLDAILTENRLRAVRRRRKAASRSRPLRVGLYRPWVASIDEGWTRWILEQYQFPFTNLYNADIRGGHLREHYDAIVIPDIAERQILDGHRPGTIPERYAGGLGEEGVAGTARLRDRWRHAGHVQQRFACSRSTSSSCRWTTRWPGCRPDQFFCSGCLVTVHIEDAKNPLTAGLTPDTMVMFERGPAFDTKTGFQRHGAGALSAGAVAAARAAIWPGRTGSKGRWRRSTVDYGKGRVILLGFKPQWRGQSHAAYKFFFNAFYGE